VNDGDENLLDDLAARYAAAGAKQGLDHAELVALGRQGLATARDRYRPDVAHRWETYATWWIRQAITSGLAK
jgi:DNA-directed RNA polymerase sigma subunit (sigma70/sigma32)